MNLRLAFVSLLAAAAALTACTTGKDTDAPGPTAEVATVTAATASIEDTVAGVGQVEFAPARAVSLVVEVESQVTAVLSSAGAHVAAGEPLLRLRPSATTRLEVDRATREAALAAGEQRRLAQLREEGLATDAEAAAARTQAETLGRLRDSLVERTGGGREYVLRAPRDGIVDTLSAQPGDLLPAASVVVRLGDAAGLQARLGLEGADATRVARGARAHLVLLDARTETLNGEVTAVERRIDKETRLAAALVALPAAATWMPGQAVAGRIVLSTHADALVLPRAALLHESDAVVIYVVVGGKAVRRVVETGVEEEDRVEIRAGLKAGEAVVTTGNHELSDGMAVRLAQALSGHADKPDQASTP